jgi:hypothetical protein
MRFPLARFCLAGLAGAALAPAAYAGPENVAFPFGYLKGERYAVVNRADIKQFRELYAQAEVIEAVRKGKPIPSGAVLMLVQWRRGSRETRSRDSKRR